MNKLKKIWEFLINILHFILAKIFAFLKKDLTDENFAQIVQFLKFGVIGFSNNIIFFAFNLITLLALKKLSLSWDYIIANFIAFTTSVIWSFLWNNKYVFKLNENEKRSPVKTFLKTYIAYAFSGIILNNILSYIWIKHMHISKYIVPLINIAITLPINFIANKFWAYNKKNTKTEE